MNVVETAAKPLVLVAGEEEHARAMLRLRLERSGYEVVEAVDGEDALRVADERNPDLLVLDDDLPGRSGTEVYLAVQRQFLVAPPVIIITPEEHFGAGVEMLKGGSVAYISKPYNLAELTASVRAALRLQASRDAVASTDELTGLLNRRGIAARAAEAVALARRYSRPLACLMLDLDEFGELSHEFTSKAADTVLQATAARLLAVSRLPDIVGRYGGEEFTLLLPETDVVGAVAAAEKIREALDSHPVEVEGVELNVPASIGVAVWDDEMRDAGDLLTAADRALYRAKELGGNRVELDAGL
jgi:diguanylate cyclase (GGDEF)-like protein